MHSVVTKEAVPHLKQEAAADQLWWGVMSVSVTLDAIFQERKED